MPKTPNFFLRHQIIGTNVLHKYKFRVFGITIYKFGASVSQGYKFEAFGVTKKVRDKYVTVDIV